MNIVLYEIASFMVFRQSTVWRWSHTRHHSDTLIRGLDPEIAVPRPPEIIKIILGFFGLRGSIPEFKKIIMHASGKIDPEVATYLPKYEYGKVIFLISFILINHLTQHGMIWNCSVALRKIPSI
jgi:fatty acid desaturase